MSRVVETFRRNVINQFENNKFVLHPHKLCSCSSSNFGVFFHVAMNTDTLIPVTESQKSAGVDAVR